MSHIAWPKIGDLDSVLHEFKTYRRLHALPSVDYVGKVKLDGTNSSIHIDADGKAIIQSRTRIITDQSKLTDNFDFAKFVNETFDFSTLNIPRNMVVFGEWVGQGITGSGDACSQLEKRHWFIFGIFYNGRIVHDYDEITELIEPLLGDRVHVLGYDVKFTLEVGNPASIENVRSLLDDRVDQIAERDPIMWNMFGISGTGEGLVLFPTEHTEDKDLFNRLLFKHKADHHLERRPRKTAVSAKKPSSVDLGQMFVTDARCMKIMFKLDGGLGVDHITRDMFVDAVVDDIKSEESLEIDANGGWDIVKRSIYQHANRGYAKKHKPKV